MSLPLVMLVVLAIVVSARLADIYTGGHHMCPSCGARSADRHSSTCPWAPHE
jgi:hypothetical protein